MTSAQINESDEITRTRMTNLNLSVFVVLLRHCQQLSKVHLADEILPQIKQTDCTLKVEED